MPVAVVSFQFPLHRDPRCNLSADGTVLALASFQFPLHRDPRCNQFPPFPAWLNTLFQFPLHRDPRCNLLQILYLIQSVGFSSLYIGILAATTGRRVYAPKGRGFQFPLHRDPRCNVCCHLYRAARYLVSVPFTSGSSLQPNSTAVPFAGIVCFSSLYIGILAATWL